MAKARSTTHEADERAVVDMAAHLLSTEPPFSRNKHYDAFRDAHFKKALALYRRVKALAADVERALDEGLQVRVVDGVWGGRPAKQLAITGPGMRRTAWLNPSAFALLLRRCPRLSGLKPT